MVMFGRKGLPVANGMMHGSPMEAFCTGRWGKNHITSAATTVQRHLLSRLMSMGGPDPSRHLNFPVKTATSHLPLFVSYAHVRFESSPMTCLWHSAGVDVSIKSLSDGQKAPALTAAPRHTSADSSTSSELFPSWQARLQHRGATSVARNIRPAVVLHKHVRCPCPQTSCPWAWRRLPTQATAGVQGTPSSIWTLPFTGSAAFDMR